MTPAQHARAKEVFLKARELDGESRQEFLQQACAGDEWVAQEVASLLRHDLAETLIAAPTRTVVAERVDTLAGISRTGGRFVGRIEQSALHLLKECLGSRRRRLCAAGVMLILLYGLAYWTYTGMKQASEGLAHKELETILNAGITALELWIEEKKNDVRLLASRSDVREAVNELIHIAESEQRPAESLRSAPARTRLDSCLEDYDRIIGHDERDVLLTRDGLVLAAGREDLIGLKLNSEGVAILAQVFQGNTLFLKPHLNERFTDAPSADLDVPLVGVVSPIRRGKSIDSEIIAAGVFGFPVDGEYTRILSIARPGETGETYTFDENGVLLNESRFCEQLRAKGLLAKDPKVKSIFNIEIREPTMHSAQHRASALDAATWPLTPMAAAAIAAGRKGSAADQQGVILDPYVNYRGARVIGAWKWLPAYSFGAATEVEVSEQYAPLRYPVIAGWIRFGLLVGCVLSLFAAAGWIVILGRDVEHARQLGQYTIQEKIGEGGMGVVYSARHAFLQRPTAIKLLRPDVLTESSLARFEREVQLASSLTHPNTIEIFDFGRTPNGSFYCVMEFLDGTTLDDIVQSEGPLPAERVVRVLEQIAGSLNEAHQRGLVHRDIKPSNIMLCEQGGITDFVKVLDFGLAKPVDQTSSPEITSPGLIIGTPLYMAPERLRDTTIIDPRSDIYSLGAVGYYLATGQEIYDTTNSVELVSKILHERPPRPATVTSNEIPPSLEELIVNCLASRQEDRPATMREVMLRLAEIGPGVAQSIYEA